MFSLKSWPEAFDRCKTAAEINHFMLENTSDHAVFSASLQRLEGVSRIARSLAAGGGGLYASLLRSLDVFNQKSVV